MAALIATLLLVALALAIHVVWWRWRLPRNHTGALLLSFSLPPLLALGLWFGAGLRFGLVWTDLPSIVLFYAAATGTYLITYAGVEETSPSLVIIRALEQAGPQGRTRDDLNPCITEERFISPRLTALQRDGLTRSSNDGVRLTPTGFRLARFATFLAKLFNLHEGA